MSFYCYIPKTLFLIFSVCFHVEIVVSVWGVPNVTIPKAEYSGGYGGYVDLECIVDSTPNHTDVYWQKLSNGIVQNVILPRNNVYGATVTRPSLTFSRLNHNDEGQYTCFAVNIAGTGKSNPTNLTVLGGDIIVNCSITSYTEVYGSQVTLRCSVTYQAKNEPVHLFWTSSGTSTSLEGNDDHVTLSNYSVAIPDKDGFKMNHYFLTLTSLSFKDNGVYSCYFRDQVSWGFCQALKLKVIGDLPNVTIPNAEYSRGYGWHMPLECIIVSTPNLTDVYWQHLYNGTIKNITSSSPNVLYGSTITEPTLTIRRITTEDSGQYICLAVNSVGTGKSQPTILTVLGGEILVNTSMTDYTEKYGSQVTLRCSVTYETKIGPVRVNWNKYGQGGHSLVNPAYKGNDHVIFSNYSVSIPGKEGFIMVHHFLTITSLSIEDDARYVCLASSNVSTERSPTIYLKIGDVPHVYLEPGPFNVTFGKSITLKCNITSSPTHFNVYWESVSNGVTTTWHQGVTHPESEALLYLDNASPEDTGQYICFAENILGIGKSKPENLTVYGGQNYPVVNIVSNQYVVTYGSSLTINCLVHTSAQDPINEIYWKFNNNGVITKISEKTDGISGSSIKTPSLTILRVTSSESGHYTCYARNNVGTGKSRPILVIITGDVPTVYVKDTKYSIKYGGNVTISCNITSNPPITNVYWEREFNGTTNVINSWTAGVQGVSLDAPSLNIVKTTTLNNGSYRCIASNNVGIGYSETTALEVIGELPYISITAEFLQVKYGEKVHISCVVNAIPPATEIYWEKESNGIKYVINTGTTGTEGITVANPALILTHATDSDTGLYKCFAVNEFGMGYSSAIKLNVIGGIPDVDVPSLTHITGVGYTITLTCSIKNAFPAISKVYWERYIYGSITRLSSDSIGIMGVTVDNPSLIIPMAMESMTGEYTCLAVNSVGTGRSFPAKLTVKPGVTPGTNSDDSDDDTDYTDTVVKGIIGAVSAVAGVGSLVIAYLAYKRSKKQEDQKGNKYKTSSNDSRHTSNKNTARTGNGSKKKTSSC